MGVTKLSWQEIESWLRLTGYRLSPWEISTIRRLSEEYVAEYNQASEKNRKAPYVTTEQADRELIANKIGNILDSFSVGESKYIVEED